MLVGTYSLGTGPYTRPVQVYDSGLTFPERWSTYISQEDFAQLKVPSVRYYYLGPHGEQIPFPSLVANDDGLRDLQAWYRGSGDVPVAYAKKRIPAGQPFEDLYEIVAGTKIKADRVGGIYTQGLINSIRDAGYNGPMSKRMLDLLLSHPPNPLGSPFGLDTPGLLSEPSLQELQQYLDYKGVVHFRADDIINLPLAERFFYLTRFYPPPPIEPLPDYLVINRYKKQARTQPAIEILSRLLANLPIYRLYTSQFEAQFNAINQDPDNEAIWKSVGGTNKDRFYRDYFNYLRLYGRPASLPQLTLNTIQSLYSLNMRNLTEFLKDFTDLEIVNLVGDSVDLVETRRELIEEAARILLSNQYLLLLPTEANLCRSVRGLTETVLSGVPFRELDYPFVGKGNFANRFLCYDIFDVLQGFESNKTQEGEYQFLDPLTGDTNLTIEDLEGFRDAFARGRGGIPPATSIVERINQYIDVMKLQTASSYNKIRQLRTWAGQGPENRRLLSEIWRSYFRIGMYMRQWKGPGNPYPLLKEETGTEASVGSREEGTIQFNIATEAHSFNELADKLPENIREIFWSLPIYSLAQNGWNENRENTIRDRSNQMFGTKEGEREFCIRVASRPWIYTAVFYLKQILNEEVEGFPLGTQIVPIS